jgi:hypothetical protein
MTIVIKIIWIVKIRFTSIVNSCAIFRAIETDTIEAATFAIVLPTRIVINKRLGNEIRSFAYLDINLKDLKSSSKFFCFNEKNATSEAEKKAEMINNKTSKATWYDQSISKKM